MATAQEFKQQQRYLSIEACFQCQQKNPLDNINILGLTQRRSSRQGNYLVAIGSGLGCHTPCHTARESADIKIKKSLSTETATLRCFNFHPLQRGNYLKHHRNHIENRDTTVSSMDKNQSSPAGRRNDPAPTSLPNQHHAIQYSSKFTSDSSKPVPLAHFMGARRDLKGPVLTKQRVDEKEIRPEGWELAEKRFQQAQSGGGINSLASLLSAGSQGGASNLSSHAGNFTKRALPGMVPLDRIQNEEKQRNTNDHHNNQSDTKSSFSSKFQNIKLSTSTDPSSQSNPPGSTSHAAAYLKPKSLADRLAQLGVSNDVQSIKTNNSSSHPAASSPRADKFPIDQISKQPEHDPVLQQDPSKRNINRIPKSHSAIFTNSSQQTSLEDKPDRNAKTSLSAHIAPPRGVPSSTPQSRVSPILSSPQPDTPLIAAPNGPSQPNSCPSYKRSTRPQSALPHVPHISTENSATLGVPNKALTASLSRLAGSNIVAQRLEWSKQKEQLGTMDEFGSPVVKTSPNSTASALHSQIPSPVLPSPSLPTQQNLVFSERSKNLNEPPPEIHSRGSSQSRLQSIQRENTGPTLTEPALAKKQLNQYNKSNRSDEDDDQRFGVANNRDNKRNKKNTDPLRSSSPTKKENEGRGRGPQAANDVNPSVTSPLRLSQKSRARVPRRPSGSTPGNRPRIDAAKVSSPPPANMPSRQLPSIPTFSPLMKKGTSELAAVWGTQLSNSVKKPAEGDSLPKKPSQPLSSPLNSHRPLPTPPSATLPARPKPATAVDSRPLPVPPASSVTATPHSPEPRARTRPLPIPQIKSEPQPLKDNKFNVPPQRQLDVSRIWASYEEKRQSLSALIEPDGLVQLEIFQLNRNHMDEFSTTMLDPDDYGIFFSQETLLIICTMKGSKMVLMIWKGRDVEEDDEGETEARIERLLKKYGIERQSKLVIVHQGYEPPELVQALGGRLLLRTGDRFDSIYQRGLSAVFTCKSFPLLPSESQPSEPDARVIVIEENMLDLSQSLTLCTGYSTLLKVCDESRNKLSLYLWKGRASNSLEVEECKLLAQQVRNEAGPLKGAFEEIEEGNESDEFLSIFCNAVFARSYHWKYKELVPMRPLIIDSGGQALDRVARRGVSVVWTGLEVFVLVCPGHKSKAEVDSGLALAQALARVHPAHPGLRHKRTLAVHCLLFPSIVPVDLLASVRFAVDLHRFNNGPNVPSSMNLVSLDEARQDPSASWLST
ncbi:hypothetical protein PCANC_18939 [Puccinia coronata f. sp. avenae]|uniref:Gelsolin-like domain-containing protein n=1 Tax=Puccinia coronata f. sp. avenae TaxID=200324 RepID=A0A2N5SJ76_9BASI|nr:hypothetical protein PCANC_18939 [Puccinia coronata f. sp. avenae]